MSSGCNSRDKTAEASRLLSIEKGGSRPPFSLSTNQPLTRACHRSHRWRNCGKNCRKKCPSHLRGPARLAGESPGRRLRAPCLVLVPDPSGDLPKTVRLAAALGPLEGCDPAASAFVVVAACLV